MSLSQTDIEAIREEAALHPKKSAVSIEALKIVQKRHGWVSDDHLKELAALLDMSPAELDAVATFYNLIYRQPVGRQVIHYCNSVTCWMLGAENLREHIEQHLGVALGETTPDGRYTLLPTVCLGACDRAPVILVGEQTHFQVEPGQLEGILKD